MDLPSLTPFTVASSGRLQLGVADWATLVGFVKVVVVVVVVVVAAVVVVY